MNNNNTTESIITSTITQQRAEKIARNINAMDMHYQRSDDMSTWRFWSDLKKKLSKIISTLTDADKTIIKALCKEAKAEYFGLV